MVWPRWGGVVALATRLYGKQFSHIVIANYSDAMPRRELATTLEITTQEVDVDVESDSCK